MSLRSSRLAPPGPATSQFGSAVQLPGWACCVFREPETVTEAVGREGFLAGTGRCTGRIRAIHRLVTERVSVLASWKRLRASSPAGFPSDTRPTRATLAPLGQIHPLSRSARKPSRSWPGPRARRGVGCLPWNGLLMLCRLHQTDSASPGTGSLCVEPISSRSLCQGDTNAVALCQHNLRQRIDLVLRCCQITADKDVSPAPRSRQGAGECPFW